MNVIRKNIFFLMVSQVATWAASLAVLLVVPNKLGSSGFGTLAYAEGIVGLFRLAAGLGTSLFLSRSIARDRRLMGSYVWNAVLLKFAVWAVLAPAAFGVAYLLGSRGQTLLLVAIFCMQMLPYLLTEVFAGALVGIQRMARPAMWAAAQVYFQTVFGILVLALGGGIVAYALVLASSMLIPMTATALMVRPFVRHNRRFEFHIWRVLVVGGVPLLTLAFLNTLYGTLDVPILHAISGSDAVGWYGLAYRWMGLPIFVTTAVTAAYFPSFSMHGQPITSEFAPLVNKAVHIVMFATIPASFGLIFTADTIVHLIYDSDYDPSIVLIQILAVGLPIIALDTLLATALIASNRVKGYMAVAAIAACLNPFAAAIAITVTDNRYGNGAIGAAIITVVTELWIMAGALHFRSPGVLDRTELVRLARILAATAAMAPVLLLSANWPLLVQVALGIVTYGIASLAFGSITLAELTDEIKRSSPARRRDRPIDGAEEAAGLEEADPELPRLAPSAEARSEP